MKRRPRSFVFCLVGVLGLGCGMAMASQFNLDFSGLQDQEQVLGYYNGGFGSFGSGPGPSLGITFDADFLAVAANAPFSDRAGMPEGTSNGCFGRILKCLFLLLRGFR